MARSTASYERATDKVIALLKAISFQELLGDELGYDMVHNKTFDPDLPETYPADSLNFALLSPRGGTDMRTRASAHREGFQDLALSVFFAPHVDRRIQDLNIWQAVYPAIREALFSPASWGRPESGIISLEPATVSEGFPAEAPVVDAAGARILSILIGLRYSNQTS